MYKYCNIFNNYIHIYDAQQKLIVHNNERKLFTACKCKLARGPKTNVQVHIMGTNYNVLNSFLLLLLPFKILWFKG